MTNLNLFFIPAGADKKAEAGAGSATEFQFVSVPFLSSTLWICVFRDVPTTNSKTGFYIQAQAADFSKERNY